MAHLTSNFQRSQSKVWWSDFDTIQEKKAIINYSWVRQGSPSSHKSQDSGFSDSEVSPPLNKNVSSTDNKSPDSPIESPSKQITPKKSLNVIDELSQKSPSSVEATPVTPPTVIRRPDYSYPINRENRTSRRISFSAPTSPNQDQNDDDPFRYDFAGQIDNLNYSSHDEELNNIENVNNESLNSSRSSSCKCDRDRSIKRGRTISRSSKFNRSLIGLVSPSKSDHVRLSPKKSILKKLSQVSLNEEDNNNNMTIQSLQDDDEDHPIRTSTPKPDIVHNSSNGGGPPACVQQWLNGLRFSYDHEVMSTLQTKSIAVEAGRNIKVTAAIAGKLIRSTQAHVMTIQSDFEKLEKLLAANQNCDPYEIADSLQEFTTGLIEFIEKQKQRVSLYATDDNDLKRFDENINNVIEMSIDMRMAGVKLEDEFDIEIIREDLIVLKRYVLITVRMIFEKLMRIIIHSIEETKCEMLLRSNLSTLSMMSNTDYAGFASLNAAFLANETVRVLLLHILESKQSSVRALALRSLATVCSTQEAIRQFEQTGGVEILKEVMTDQQELRCEPELRETVSVMTQLTAPWHGHEHKMKGLKDCVEGFVESITELLSTTSCCQTLLLCAACLNNFSRIEPTSIYSLMSHESVAKLQTATEKRGPGASIFLFEQITSMLLNMASNKKCHNHLGNKHTINFITRIFQQKFYEKYSSRAELDSQKKTIKNILFIISHLIHESIINPEILEEDVLPIFSQIEHSQLHSSEHNIYSKDLTFLNKKLNESLTYKNNLYRNSPMTMTKKSRQESFV